MSRSLSGPLCGRDRVRALLDGRAATGIDVGDDEAMRIAVSEQHAGRAWAVEVGAALEALSGVLEPQAARDWLFKFNPLLDGRKPAELLAQGPVEARRVRGLIDALGEGASV